GLNPVPRQATLRGSVQEGPEQWMLHPAGVPPRPHQAHPPVEASPALLKGARITHVVGEGSERETGEQMRLGCRRRQNPSSRVSRRITTHEEPRHVTVVGSQPSPFHSCRNQTPPPRTHGL